jgi:hypothetical protein
MVRRLSLSALLAALLVAGGALTAHAGNPPPPPSTPSRCGPCGGPPSPPTPVPTLPASELSPVTVVTAQLSPVRTGRGKDTKLQVTADPDDTVSGELRFARMKPIDFGGKVDGDGTYTKTIRIPKNAPLGQGEVWVSVKGPSTSYSTTLPLTVTK